LVHQIHQRPPRVQHALFITEKYYIEIIISSKSGGWNKTGNILGIVIGVMAAKALNLPLVYAKKQKPSCPLHLSFPEREKTLNEKII